MITELINIGQLTPDPSNARKHSQKNLDAIKGSLLKFGQQKPIVVDMNGVVIAGNGTLEAAKALGWTEIAIVRTNLEGVEAIAYAIADNRSGELAEWDDAVLSETLKALQIDQFDLGMIGFSQKELDKLFKTTMDAGDTPPPPEERKEFLIICEFENEMDQSDWFDELTAKGVKCKIMS